MPDKATHKTKAGAVAFVRYWVKILNFSWQHLSPDSLLAHSATTCRDCRRIAKTMRRVADAGGYQRGGVWHTTSAYAIPLQPRAAPIISTSIKVSKGVWQSSGDGKPHDIRPYTQQVDFHLTWHTGTWRMEKVVIQ